MIDQEHPLGEWYKPAQLPPASLLEGKRCPKSGRPILEDALPGELPWRTAARVKRNQARLEAWTELSAQMRTQIVACLRWGDPQNGSWWRCRLKQTASSGKDIDMSIFHEMLIRALDRAHAEARYRELMGITGFAADVVFVILPAPEIEAPAEEHVA